MAWFCLEEGTMVCDNKQPQMNAKSVFFSKISIWGGPGPCLAGIAIRKPHKIAIAIRKQHPSTVFDAKSRLSIEVFLRPNARTKTIDLGGPRGWNPDTKQRISPTPKVGEFIRRRGLPFRPHLPAHIPRMTLVASNSLKLILILILILIFILVLSCTNQISWCILGFFGWVCGGLHPRCIGGVEPFFCTFFRYHFGSIFGPGYRFFIVFLMRFLTNFGSPGRPRGAPEIDFFASFFDFFARLSF